MPSDVSVVVCVYTTERWDDIAAALHSLRLQSLPPREIIVVVDHNPPLRDRIAADFVDVTVVPNEARRGLSGARNTGVAIARGSLIAFLDDDAVAAPDWLERLCRCCEDPRILGATGFVEPVWRGGRPAWFPPEFYWAVGCTYRGMPEARAQVRNLFGGCSCVRREVFDVLGGFSATIGRIGTHGAGCEETELCIRARQHWPHRVFLYEPAARIRHAVPAGRARWHYFSIRCFFEGRSKAQVAHLVGARDGLASERAYALRTLPRGVLQGAADALLRRDPSGLARAAAIAAGLAITAAGYVTGWGAQRLTALAGRLPRRGARGSTDAHTMTRHVPPAYADRL